jgi:hypothetical protein
LIRNPDNEAESEKVLVKRLVAWEWWADIVDIEIWARTWVECELPVCLVWIFPILTVHICSGLGMPKQFVVYLLQYSSFRPCICFMANIYVELLDWFYPKQWRESSLDLVPVT